MEVIKSNDMYVISKEREKYHVYFRLSNGDLFWEANFCALEKAEEFVQEVVRGELFHIKENKVIKKEKNPILYESSIYVIRRIYSENSTRDMLFVVDTLEEAEKYLKYLALYTEEKILYDYVKVPYYTIA